MAKLTLNVDCSKILLAHVLSEAYAQPIRPDGIIFKKGQHKYNDVIKSEYFHIETILSDVTLTHDALETAGLLESWIMNNFGDEGQNPQISVGCRTINMSGGERVETPFEQFDLEGLPKKAITEILKIVEGGLSASPASAPSKDCV